MCQVKSRECPTAGEKETPFALKERSKEVPLQRG
jgi:hypothetical protein